MKSSNIPCVWHSLGLAMSWALFWPRDNELFNARSAGNNWNMPPIAGMLLSLTEFMLWSHTVGIGDDDWQSHHVRWNLRNILHQCFPLLKNGKIPLTVQLQSLSPSSLHSHSRLKSVSWRIFMFRHQEFALAEPWLVKSLWVSCKKLKESSVHSPPKLYSNIYTLLPAGDRGH